jgi:isochorismate synthase
MQVLADKLVLYVGAGITSESVAEDEWDETEIKADTLLSVIYNI